MDFIDMPIERIYEPFSEEAYDIAIQNLPDAKTHYFRSWSSNLVQSH